FIEDDDDVARRMSGRITDQKDLRFAQFDQDTLMSSTIFEYMISNLDMSVSQQHNYKIVEMPTGAKYPIPYDFDYSGLVNASYSVPPPDFHIESVRVRVYRGPCLTVDGLQPYFQKFEAIKADVLKMYDTLEGLKSGYRNEAKQFLNVFYHTIEKPDSTKRE